MIADAVANGMSRSFRLEPSFRGQPALLLLAAVLYGTTASIEVVTWLAPMGSATPFVWTIVS
jgi:hypothetical protein